MQLKKQDDQMIKWSLIGQGRCGALFSFLFSLTLFSQVSVCVRKVGAALPAASPSAVLAVRELAGTV